MTLEKTALIEIEWKTNSTVAQRKKGIPPVVVQFNPESLKVSHSNQVQTHAQNHNSAMQYVGRGRSTLAVELIFDVSGVDSSETQDVQRLTRQVSYFMVAKPTGNSGKPLANTQQKGGAKKEKQKYVVPGLRFQWGSFVFDGILTSLNENLELWSEDGYPLRSILSLSMSQPGIQLSGRDNIKLSVSAQVNAQAGIQAMTPALQGGTLQSMVANAGVNADWKAVAAINGIENPRNLSAGALVDLDVGGAISARANLKLGGGLNG